VSDDLIDEARRCAQAVYLATDAEVASDIARILNGAADAFEELRRENERLKAEVVAANEAYAEMSTRHTYEVVENERLKAIVEQQGKAIVDVQRHNANVNGKRMKANRRREAAEADLRDLRAALGGLSPEAVERAIDIAAELMAEWEEGSTHADTYYIVEAWWRSCPPEVRAQITGGGNG